jgi:hypothetical protein
MPAMAAVDNFSPCVREAQSYYSANTAYVPSQKITTFHEVARFTRMTGRRAVRPLLLTMGMLRKMVLGLEHKS